MKILITGGFGYLGLKISKFLSEKGHTISIFDLSKPDNLPDFTDKFEVYLGDVLDKDKIKKACDGADLVIHLAGLDQKKCNENPELALQVNGFGTKNVVEAAAQSGVKKLIYMSTFHVYGTPKGKITEETTPNPISNYASTKLKGESYCRKINDGMKAIVIRLSNAYGAPLSDLGWNVAVNNFCKQCIEKQTIILKTKGRQKRDFVGIPDVNQAINILAQADSRKIKYDVYNLGGNNLLSIFELAQLIAQCYFELYEKKVLIEFEENAADEQPMDFSFGISRIQDMGYSPKTSLKKEIEETLKVCKGVFGE